MSTLKNYITYVVDNRGKTPPLSETGIELIEVNAIQDGRKCPDYDKVRKFVSGQTYSTWFRTGHPTVGDVLVTTVGAIGRVAYVGNARGCIAQNIVAIRPDSKRLDGNFLFYFMASENTQTRLSNLNIGVAQPSLKVPHLLDLEVAFPPLPTQRKIAAILSAYDDLIENNTRRIQLLEESAQLLYREWFVRFRFPGHERVRMVESDLGPIPEGWEMRPIGEVVPVLGGGTPSKAESSYWENGSITWYTPSDLTAANTMFISESSSQITELGLEKSSARMFPAYSVMMTSRATVGVVSINTTEACTNQGFIICVPNEIFSVYLLYYWIIENREKIISLASGATFKEITRTTFRQLPVLIPDKTTHKAFDQHMAAVGQQIQNLLRRNTLLHTTRDLLLPRLISGEVDVAELEIAG